MKAISLLVALWVSQCQSAKWAEVEVILTMQSTRTVGICTVVPKEGPRHGKMEGYLTTFNLTCSGWTDPHGGLLTYKLYYTREGYPGRFLAYIGASPTAQGILLPPGNVTLFMQVTSSSRMSDITSVTSFHISPPTNMEASMQEMVKLTLAAAVGGEPSMALTMTHLALTALQDLPSDSSTHRFKGTLATVLTRVAHDLPWYYALEETVEAVGLLVQADGVESKLLNITGDLLVHLARGLLEARKIITQVETQQLVRQIVGVQSRLLQLLHMLPEDPLLSQHVSQQLQEVSTTLPQVLMTTISATHPFVITTPTLSLVARRIMGEVWPGTSVRTDDAVMELPHGAHTTGQPQLMTVVTSRLNPMGPHILKQPASKFIAVSLLGMTELSVMLHMSSTTVKEPVVMEELVFVEGNFTCSKVDGKCVWHAEPSNQVVFHLNMSGSIVTFTRLADNSSLDLPPDIVLLIVDPHSRHPARFCMQNIQRQNHDTVEVLTINNTKMVVHGTGVQTLTVQLASTSMAPLWCNATCTADEQPVSIPVKVGLKVVQYAETRACVAYDRQVDRYLPACTSIPTNNTDLVCHCQGSGLYTAISFEPSAVPGILEVVKRGELEATIISLVLVALMMVLCLVSYLVDCYKHQKVEPKSDSCHADTYSVFLYTSYRPWAGTNADIRVQLGYMDSWTKKVTVRNKRMLLGECVHMEVEVPSMYGPVEKVHVELDEDGSSWLVDHIVVSDPVLEEKVLFKQAAWVDPHHTWTTRTEEDDWQAWLLSLWYLWVVEVCLLLPPLLPLLHSCVRTSKLERSLMYVMAAALWWVSLIWLDGVWRLEDDDCLPSSSLPEWVWVLPVVIFFACFIFTQVLLKRTLIDGERRAPDDMFYWLRPRSWVPYPYWCRIAYIVIGIIATLALMTHVCIAYTHMPPATLSRLNTVFCWGILLQIVTVPMLVTLAALFEMVRRCCCAGFVEKVMNRAEGLYYPCHQCGCYLHSPRHLHHHTADNLVPINPFPTTELPPSEDESENEKSG